MRTRLRKFAEYLDSRDMSVSMRDHMKAIVSAEELRMTKDRISHHYSLCSQEFHPGMANFIRMSEAQKELTAKRYTRLSSRF